MMNDHEGSEPRWRRKAVEVLTIVVGILLALAADAGRQYVSDRSAERQMLASLRIEFANDIREIGADQASRAEKLAAIDLLSQVHDSTVKSPNPETLAAALLRTIDYRFYTPSHAVLDDLLSTGRLDLIQSDDLRRAIMAFGQERSRLAVVEERERDFVARAAEPYLAQRLDLEALSSPRSPEQFAAATRAVPGVLASPSFGSLLYLDRDRTESSLHFADRLLDTVSAVRKALGEQN